MPRIKRSSRAYDFRAEQARRGIVTVGEGFGFVAEAENGDRIVITSFHCISSADFEGQDPLIDPVPPIYSAQLGAFGEKPTVWADCLFANPLVDLAILGSPDERGPEDIERYYALVTGASSIGISEIPPNASGLLFSPHGEWFTCTVSRHLDGPLWIKDAAEDIPCGMSGSPIFSRTGAAVGILCSTDSREPSGPNARLMRDLPGWALRNLKRSRTSQKRLLKRSRVRPLASKLRVPPAALQTVEPGSVPMPADLRSRGLREFFGNLLASAGGSRETGSDRGGRPTKFPKNPRA